MSKVVILPDLHLRKEDIGEARKALNTVLHTAIAQKAEYIVALGDVFDKPLPEASVQKVWWQFVWQYLTFSNNGQIIALVGNHDKNREGSVLSAVPFPRFLCIDEQPRKMMIADREWILLPYTRIEGNLNRWLEENISDDAIVFGHWYLSTAIYDDIQKISPLLLQKARLVFLGHQHIRQQMGHIYIGGLLQRRNLQDKDAECGFYIWDMDRDVVDWIELTARQIIKITPEQINEVDNIEDIFKNDNTARYYLPHTYMDRIDGKLRARYDIRFYIWRDKDRRDDLKLDMHIDSNSLTLLAPEQMVLPLIKFMYQGQKDEYCEKIALKTLEYLERAKKEIGEEEGA